MSTVMASPRAVRRQTGTPANIPLICAALLTVTFVACLIVAGVPYYVLSPEDRPYSPLHPVFRSSGTVGLKLGIFGVVLFGVLFLYPLRKRWPWLAQIGNTRRWLNAHVLTGIAAPVIVTFHSAFRWHGLAGVAWGIMVVVALSGFIGRYLYVKIPRRLNAVKLSTGDLESETSELVSALEGQSLIRPEDFASLLKFPTSEEIRRMNLLSTLWVMFRLDAARPFHVYRLRRNTGHSREAEDIIANVRQLSSLRTKAAFLHRTEQVFHLWHVIHRPFSFSFVVLVVIHIGVALSVGVR